MCWQTHIDGADGEPGGARMQAGDAWPAAAQRIELLFSHIVAEENLIEWKIIRMKRYCIIMAMVVN